MTILLNDDAYGQFSFDSSSVSVSIEEAGEVTMAANGTHQLLYFFLMGESYTACVVVTSCVISVASGRVESDSQWWSNWGGICTLCTGTRWKSWSAKNFCD